MQTDVVVPNWAWRVGTVPGCPGEGSPESSRVVGVVQQGWQQAARPEVRLHIRQARGQRAS
jgi:hypothetical protein